MFSMQPVYQNPLKATFHFLSAASLILGLIQNGVLGNGLDKLTVLNQDQCAHAMQPNPNLCPKRRLFLPHLLSLALKSFEV